MPKLGLTMTEGAVVEWPLAEGARFDAGTVVVVIETDKTTSEVEAPAPGVLKRILVQPGETVAVGTVIAEWESDAAASATGPAPVTAAPAAVAGAGQPVRVAPGAIALAAARRLTQSKQQIPHFYLSTEIDAGPLQAFRAQWNGNADKSRRRLSVTHVFLSALGRVLGRHRELNRVWDAESFLELPTVDIGIAVNTEQGLLVPVLRNADQLGLQRLAESADALIARARGGKLAPDDAGGGAITLSNAGMYDVTHMTSIINPGQSAILGVGSERRTFRPDASGAPRPVGEIGVVLSCDHRVLDGVAGLKLLGELRSLLAAPESLLD